VSHHPLRILYAGGPGDVVGTFRRWLGGDDDPAVPDVAYSRQFFDVCRDLGAEAWVISAHPRVETVEERGIRVEHRPIPWNDRSGLRWHWGRIRYGRGLVRSAREFGADVAVISGHGMHWFSMSALAKHGIRAVACIHNGLWPMSSGPGRVGRLLMPLNRAFFERACKAVLSHPGLCEQQVATLTGGACGPVVPFLPFYRAPSFAEVAGRWEPSPPFRVLFVGRIEPEKGVFDLLEVARQLRRDGRTDIEIDVCGDGSALGPLKSAAAEAGLGDGFRLHGPLRGQALRDQFARSHAVVVPTRSSCGEGFNAVICEAVLSGRPVITSRACPALRLVADAALEVEPDDVAGYRAAIVRLREDPALTAAKREACRKVAGQFLDSGKSWGAGLKGILRAAG
jgi:glycosyltransferase involved in cell wall biosynthesis